MSDILVLFSSSRIQWFDQWEIISSPSTGRWKLVKSCPFFCPFIYTRARTDVMNNCSGYSTKHTYLTWPSWLYMTSTWLAPFMPFLPHTSQQQEGRHSNKQGGGNGEILLLLQKVPLFPKTGIESNGKCLLVVGTNVRRNLISTTWVEMLASLMWLNCSSEETKMKCQERFVIVDYQLHHTTIQLNRSLCELVYSR